jgi:hypothetical protein
MPYARQKVLIIGDSIRYITSGQISNQGDTVQEDSTDNRMVFMTLATRGIGAYHKKNDRGDYWQVLIPNVMDRGEFDAVVVELGTNDCAYVIKKSGDYRAYIQIIIDSIRSVDSRVPILWLTMRKFTDYPSCARIINNDLIAEGVETLPYGIWANSHPECFAKDGIYPKEDWRQATASGGTGADQPAGYCNGRTEYAAWLKGRLDNYFGPTVN